MSEQIQGTVMRVKSASCAVDADGTLYECAARRRLVDGDTGESKPVVVGDRVVFTVTGEGVGVVEDVLPRRTKLSRRSPNDPLVEHIIVANLDQLLIVASVRRPPLTLGIIDRYVIAAEYSGVDAVVCINKVDLAGDSTEHLEAAEVCRGMGYRALLTSARTGEGLDALRGVLRGRTTCLAGHSGVGKSALINAVQPGLDLRTADVGWRGRHTTTTVSLLRLDFGGYVVDTPGIREFDLWDIEPHEVQQFFPAIWERGRECKMRGCGHTHEPDCAVRQAVEDGSIPLERYQSYLRIVGTVETPGVPRATDVDAPKEQIAKKKRTHSRRARRQDLRRQAQDSINGGDDTDGN